MTWQRSMASAAALLAGLFAVASCGDSGEPEPGKGGASSTGGAASQGGAMSSTSGGRSSNGGAASTGGASPTGGKSSDGGTSTSGGRESDGGATSTGGKASGGTATNGGRSGGGGDSATGGVRGGVQCGSRICGTGLLCCNASCSRCAPPGTACDQQACDASGGSGGSAGGGACTTVADCRLFDDYCDGCTCRVLGKTDPDPRCTGTMVSCLVEPCANSSAACESGRCVRAPAR